jgi:hypothetical protein
MRRRTDVEPGSKVMWRRAEREPVQRNNFFPGELVGGAPAHANIINGMVRGLPKTLTRDRMERLWTAAIY